MRDFIILFIHVIVTMARLAGPGGLRSVVAESALIRHQVLILNRGRKRAPNLRVTDRIAAGLLTLCMSPARILRSAIVLKPSTLLHLHMRIPMMSISYSDPMPIRSERSDAGLSQCEIVIGISQDFCLFSLS
jgi:hypothetical protein